MILRGSLLGMICLLLALSAVAVAQQPEAAPNQAGQERIGKRKGLRHEKLARRGFGRLPAMRELNLTEEQRQQHRAIIQRHLESIKSQREELFKLREKRIAGTLTSEDEVRAQALRQEIQSAMQGARTEIESLLTPEQRAKLDDLKSERKARLSEMRRRVRERRDNIPQ